MRFRDSLRALARRAAFRRTPNHDPDLLTQFRTLLTTRRPTPTSSVGPRVGFASFGAGAHHLVVDSLLAHSLQLRGAVCQLLLCDLPSCPGATSA
jgi:hypothetical protein